MILREFIKDDVQSWYKSVQLQYSLLANYASLVLNQPWFGNQTIETPLSTNTFITDAFTLIPYTDGLPLLFGDVIEVIQPVSGATYTTSVKRFYEQPQWYAIYAHYGAGVTNESNNPPDPNPYVAKWLAQPNIISSNKEIVSGDTDLLEVAIGLRDGQGATINIYRPKNNTNLFPGDRETESLDTDSDYDYPSVKLVRWGFAQFMNGGKILGEATDPAHLPTDASQLDRPRPGDHVVVSDFFTNDNPILNPPSPRWTMKRLYTIVSIGGVSTDAFTYSGALVFKPGPWLDDPQGLNYLDIKKQNVLTAGTAIQIIDNGRDGSPIINWTGDPGLQASLIPWDDTTTTPATRHWRVIVSGDRADGDEELMGYKTGVDLIITEVATGTYHTNGVDTWYEFADVDTQMIFALSRNLTQAVGDALDFSNDQIVWMDTQIDTYTRDEVDTIITNLTNNFNTQITNIQNQINNITNSYNHWPLTGNEKTAYGTKNLEDAYGTYIRTVASGLVGEEYHEAS